MTTLQLNAEIYRNLAVLSEDETMLEKAAKYLRRLAKQMTDDLTCMSKEQTIAPALRRRINKARKEYAEGQTVTCKTPQEMQQFFDSL